MTNFNDNICYNLDFNVGERVFRKIDKLNGIIVKIENNQIYVKFYKLGNLVIKCSFHEIEKSSELSKLSFDQKNFLLFFWVKYIYNKVSSGKKIFTNVVNSRKNYSENIKFLNKPDNLSLPIYFDTNNEYNNLDYDLSSNTNAKIVGFCNNLYKIKNQLFDKDDNFLLNYIKNNFKYNDLYFRLKNERGNIGWVPIWMVQPLISEEEILLIKEIKTKLNLIKN
jgi:hypothetical protein